MKVVRLALLASLLSLAPAVPALSATSAVPTRSGPSVEANASACPGSIRLGGKRYAYFRRGVGCVSSRAALRRLYASRGKRGTPRGFKCRSQSGFRKTGSCTNRSRSRYFGYSR